MSLMLDFILNLAISLLDGKKREVRSARPLRSLPLVASASRKRNY
jgi:hypothetical protein